MLWYRIFVRRWSPWTAWGPTNTGWFRSGQDHKRACLDRLAKDFPKIKWLLIGDDGQHDPKIYQDFAEARPKRVEAIRVGWRDQQGLRGHGGLASRVGGADGPAHRRAGDG